VTDFDRYMDNLTDPVQLRRIAKEARDEMALYRDRAKTSRRELEDLRSAARSFLAEFEQNVSRQSVSDSFDRLRALIPETEETPK
jgi:hypothetical protein